MDAWGSLSKAEQEAIKPAMSHQPTQSPAREISPKLKLEHIRERTCYGVLRLWLKLIFGGVLFVFFACAALIVIGGNNAENTLMEGHVAALAISVGVFLFLAVVAAWAVYQASLLLVDIADATIQRGE